MGSEAARVLAVVALVCAAASLATPPGRLPLALRGIRRMLHKDSGAPRQRSADEPAPLWRRVLAFFLVLLAAGLAAAG
jgi:hypothetical protein